MIEITINCPEIGKLTQAIEKLSGAVKTESVDTEKQPIPAMQNPVETDIAVTPVSTAPASTVAPTNNLSYTLDQLAVAAAPLMSAGKQKELTAMLKEFGLASLTELPSKQYPAVAQKLREMGAKI